MSLKIIQNEKYQIFKLYFGESKIVESKKVRHGFGWQVYLNGAHYVGQWRDDFFDGQGLFYVAPLIFYQGEFKEGNFVSGIFQCYKLQMRVSFMNKSDHILIREADFYWENQKILSQNYHQNQGISIYKNGEKNSKNLILQFPYKQIFSNCRILIQQNKEQFLIIKTIDKQFRIAITQKIFPIEVYEITEFDHIKRKFTAENVEKVQIKKNDQNNFRQSYVNASGLVVFANKNQEQDGSMKFIYIPNVSVKKKIQIQNEFVHKIYQDDNLLFEYTEQQLENAFMNQNLLELVDVDKVLNQMKNKNYDIFQTILNFAKNQEQSQKIIHKIQQIIISENMSEQNKQQKNQNSKMIKNTIKNKKNSVQNIQRQFDQVLNFQAKKIQKETNWPDDVYVGTKLGGRKIGYGYQRSFDNSYSFRGFFKNDKKFGQGYLVLNNNIYVGEFLNDEAIGEFINYRQDGKFKGKFVDGKFFYQKTEIIDNIEFHFLTQQPEENLENGLAYLYFNENNIQMEVSLQNKKLQKERVYLVNPLTKQKISGKLLLGKNSQKGFFYSYKTKNQTTQIDLKNKIISKFY